MLKFQLCTLSALWVIGELINFQVKNRHFLCFFVCQFTIMRPRIPKIGTHDAYINSSVESEFPLSRFNRLLVMSKSILICQNLRTKTKVLRDHAKSQWAKFYCNYILFAKLLWPEDSKWTFCFSIQVPSVYHTRWRLHTVPLIAESPAGKLWIPFLIVIALTQPKMDLELGNNSSISHVLKEFRCMVLVLSALNVLENCSVIVVFGAVSKHTTDKNNKNPTVCFTFKGIIRALCRTR